MNKNKLWQIASEKLERLVLSHKMPTVDWLGVLLLMACTMAKQAGSCSGHFMERFSDAILSVWDPDDPANLQTDESECRDALGKTGTSN